MTASQQSKSRRSIVQGERAPLHLERLLDLLRRFDYAPNKSGLQEAITHWKRRGGRLKSPHTVTKLFRTDKRVAEDTRRDLCEMFLALARGHESQLEIAEVLPKLKPDYFILRHEADELHSRVDEHLETLTRGLARNYYVVPGDGWGICESLTRARRLLHDLAGHLDRGSSDKQRLRVASLAHAWLEAAHLAGTESPVNMKAVHTIGKRALGRADESGKTAVLLGLLGHSSPVDASARRAVSGVTWHQPSDAFDDEKIELSLLKHVRARADYLFGVRGREDGFSVRQIVLGARLKLCSNLESRTNDAQNDLSRAKELLSGTNDRTHAYYYLASHYSHSRRLAGMSTKSGLRRKQLDDIRLARHHYAAQFRSEPNLYTAACDIRLAELSPSSVTREELIEAVTTILGMPFDRCCVADLSGVFDGRSSIYKRIAYDEESFRQRADRQRRVRRSN
jgi:hypothetical protein